MNRGDDAVGLSGDDPHRLAGIAVLRPRLPQAGVGVEVAVSGLNAVGLFMPAFALPLVEAISDDQTPALVEGFAEVWFLGDGFGPGVDRLRP